MCADISMVPKESGRTHAGPYAAGMSHPGPQGRVYGVSRMGSPGLLLAALVFLMPAAALALSTDADQPMQITADKASYDEASGTMVYRGNVRVTQGSLAITAETLTTHAPQRELERVEAEGDEKTGKATWRQLADDGMEIRAEARRMDYLAAERRILMIGDAVLWQGEDRFRGERIEYDLDTETMDAVAGDEGRIEIILQPRRREE